MDMQPRNDPPPENVVQLVRMGVSVDKSDYVVALAGNPNVGKSTVFNTLTGLRQHTGNWPGKTVARAEGAFHFDGHTFKIVDLPGTYSLMAATPDEEVARNFILFGKPHVTVIVVDASRLERNLNLALQVLEITDRAVICLNLMDEAARHGIEVDHERLSKDLGVPVVPTSARFGKGTDELLKAIHEVAQRDAPPRAMAIAKKPKRLEIALSKLADQLRGIAPALPNAEWVAMRLLDGDSRVAEAIRKGELASLSAIDEEGEGAVAANSTASATTADAEAVLRSVSELRWEVGPRFHEQLVESLYAEAGKIADRVVTRPGEGEKKTFDRTLDRIVTSRALGVPIMIAMLAAVLYITVLGANVPSGMLAWLLVDTIHPILKEGAATIGLPWWLDGLLIDGVYLATAWVIAVMLPPMAIFFPLFTLLEDFGYLPRAAFNLDGMFRRCGAHGKQALTMCMGFGCNAAGVVACRVIDSPRERLIAIITNNFSLCNGRWPTQILIASVFIGALAPSAMTGAISALAVVCVALLGVGLTFGVSWALSRTVLRGEASTFSMELPPYRPPRILQTLYTSLIDRTIFVLWRAIVFAVPAGAAIWLVGKVEIGGVSVAAHFVNAVDPFAALFGLTGIVLLAYIVAIPANEIVVPTIMMLTTVLVPEVAGLGAGAGVMFESDDPTIAAQVLSAGGITMLTAVCLMLFCLLHNPCSTTIYTIWKETRSVRWTLLASLLPLVMGFVVCFFVAQFWRLVAG
jgi:ferrous iron transport protein B